MRRRTFLATVPLVGPPEAGRLFAPAIDMSDHGAPVPRTIAHGAASEMRKDGVALAY